MKAKVNIRIGFFVKSLFLLFIFAQCSSKNQETLENDPYNVLFLHHSTGFNIWKGKTSNIGRIDRMRGKEYDVPAWFTNYNKSHGTNYQIKEQAFPKTKPYGWHNYPYDYYNIWVKHGDDNYFREEPTLKTLTVKYDLIIFKHCFPVSGIEDDLGNPNIDSPDKRIENYKLQYEALKETIHQFPDTKFLLWTGAALVKRETTPEKAARSSEFFDWVVNDWDEKNDNLFLWNFYKLETEGGIYLKDEYAVSQNDSHPNKEFAARVVPLFCQRIVEVIETN
jgi:hypothetical protein